VLLFMLGGTALGWGLGRGEIVEAPTHFYLESMRLDQLHGHSASSLVMCGFVLVLRGDISVLCKGSSLLGQSV